MAPRTLMVTGAVAIDAAEPDVGPRRDYAGLRDRLGADLLHAGMLRRPWPRVLRGLALARAAAARAHDYEHVYCDSEHIGIPLAFLLRRRPGPKLSMIAHYLTPPKKRTAIRALRASSRFDRVILHSPTQCEPALAAGFEESQLALVPYQVDAAFWNGTAPSPPLGHIMSAGQEFRDYRTLLHAVEGLPVDVKIAAGSHWSQRRLNFTSQDVPGNVTIGQLPYAELRDAYAAARFVVVPLCDVDFQAGIITILEAMSMGKAVIVSRTRGQTGVVTGPLMCDGALRDVGEAAWSEATGLYVPPDDCDSLRSAIRYLLDRPDVAARMGRAARAHVEAGLSLDHFVERMAAIIEPTKRQPSYTSVAQ